MFFQQLCTRTSPCYTHICAGRIFRTLTQMFSLYFYTFVPCQAKRKQYVKPSKLFMTFLPPITTPSTSTYSPALHCLSLHYSQKVTNAFYSATFLIILKRNSGKIYYEPHECSVRQGVRTNNCLLYLVFFVYPYMSRKMFLFQSEHRKVIYNTSLLRRYATQTHV